MAFSTHDQVPDSPTNTFATWNALNKQVGDPVYSNGNLLAQDTVNNVMNAPVTCHFPRIEGFKWYAEFYYYEGFYDTGAAAAPMSFIVTSDEKDSSLGIYSTNVPEYFAGSKNSYAQYRTYNNTMPSRSYPVTVNYGLVGILFDYNLNTIQFAINGNWCSEVFPMDSNAVISGINLSGKYNLSGSDSLYVRVFHGGSDIYKVAINCGQDHTFGGYPNSLASSSGYSDANGIGSFYYQPPTGALALCTANLPDPDIDPKVDDLPQDYMKSVLYTGNGSTQSITGVGFQPDLVWAKSRSTAIGHGWYDSVRGANKYLAPSSVSGEQNYAGVTAFNSDGFSVGASSDTNNNNSTFVAWCFRAGGSPSATDDGTGVSGSAKLVDTSGAASSTTCKSFKDAAVAAGASNVICPSKMSINQKAGFSIVKYTGNGTNPNGSIPHGLNQAPDLIIIKSLSTGEWPSYHSALPVSNTLYLNDGYASSTYINRFSSVTNYVFVSGSNGGDLNTLNTDYIAYCWHSVAGYSNFSSYIGNGSTTGDGPFVYTGFKPAWVMIKSSSYTTTTYTSWAIYDNARETYNPNNNVLYANKSINEGYRGDASTAATDINVDFLSNGFKVRSDKAEINQNTETYIYACFAQTPFKYSATNAR